MVTNKNNGYVYILIYGGYAHIYIMFVYIYNNIACSYKKLKHVFSKYFKDGSKILCATCGAAKTKLKEDNCNWSYFRKKWYKTRLKLDKSLNCVYFKSF